MNNFATENRDELLAAHPTVKSLPLVKDAILYVSDENDLVLDLFGCSGTTLIAFEETNRQCNIMELGPKHVDTIICRWQKQIDKEVILKSAGKIFEEICTERNAV